MRCARSPAPRRRRSASTHRFGMLAPGYAADAVLLDHDWTVTEVWADGTRR